MVQANIASFCSIATHSVKVNHHQVVNTVFKKKSKNYDVQYIILFMFLWNPTSSPFFYNKL
jgi:hypothetical protein